MKQSDESIVDYRCVKCRNTTAVVRRINLAKGILPELLIGGGGRYRFVTCSLCGYTEIYDLSIYARKPSAENANNKAAHLAPETPQP